MEVTSPDKLHLSGKPQLNACYAIRGAGEFGWQLSARIITLILQAAIPSSPIFRLSLKILFVIGKTTLAALI